MSDEIYMSISFPKLSTFDAQEILKEVTKAVGLVSYNIYVNDDPEDVEEDEETPGYKKTRIPVILDRGGVYKNTYIGTGIIDDDGTLVINIRGNRLIEELEHLVVLNQISELSLGVSFRAAQKEEQ